MATVVTPDPAVWDSFVETRGGSLLQTARWGQLKAQFGWQDHLIAVQQGDEMIGGALVLTRRLPLGQFAYVPRGPVVDWDQPQHVHAVLAALDGIGTAFVKIEPDATDSEAIRDLLAEHGWRESEQTVQPPRTVLIDVDDAPDAIMARMNQSTRRKIRLSDRRDVAIRRGDSADVAVFSQLAEITGERNDFGVHSEAYHQMAFDLFAPDHAVLLMASYEGQDLAGLMAFQWGDRAYYLYGASSSKERNRMPTYGLQWAAMEWAREKGCTVYDMWGIPDADEEILEAEFQERRDGLWGVYGFKRGFGGRVVRSVGAWDKVYNPAVYAAYRLILRAREAL